jgi:hypothetical protein
MNHSFHSLHVHIFQEGYPVPIPLWSVLTEMQSLPETEIEEMILSPGPIYMLPAKLLSSLDLIGQIGVITEYYAEVGRWANMTLDQLDRLCDRDEIPQQERQVMRTHLEALRVRLAVMNHGLTKAFFPVFIDAVKGGKLRLSGRVGGKEGGKTRRHVSAFIREECRAIAKALWKDNPALSALQVARKVHRQLKKASSSHIPAVHTIRVRYIADLSPHRP